MQPITDLCKLNHVSLSMQVQKCLCTLQAWNIVFIIIINKSAIAFAAIIKKQEEISRC